MCVFHNPAIFIALPTFGNAGKHVQGDTYNAAPVIMAPDWKQTKCSAVGKQINYRILYCETVKNNDIVDIFP